MQRIVLAANSRGSLTSVAASLNGGGMQVIPTRDVASALSFIKRGANLLAIEGTLEFADEILLGMKLDPTIERTPVFVVYQPADSPERSKNFLVLPDDYLEAPVDAARFLERSRRWLQRRRTLRLYEREISLQFGTTPEHVERAGDVADQFLEAAGFTDEEQAKLGHAFREAIGNAAEHGNRHDPNRLIRVFLFLDLQKAIISITDEGPGFDHEAFLGATDAKSALEVTRGRRGTEARPGGLGVFIFKGACDEVSYSASGSTIFLKKYLSNRVSSFA